MRENRIKLKKFLKQHKLSQEAFAIMCAIDRGGMSRLVNKGKFLPSLRHAFTIEDKTKGIVKARNWLK